MIVASTQYELPEDEHASQVPISTPIKGDAAFLDFDKSPIKRKKSAKSLAKKLSICHLTSP